MAFMFSDASIPDIKIIKTNIYNDSRGAFFESFKYSVFKKELDVSFVQENISISNRYVLRGLHFQYPPKAQGKLIQVLKGSIKDFVLDLRPSSKTYLKWLAFHLEGVDDTMIYIPPGFAHGFISLENDTIFKYLCTEEYSLKDEGGIIWSDPKAAVEWGGNNFIISEKDRNLPNLSQIESKLKQFNDSF